MIGVIAYLSTTVLFPITISLLTLLVVFYRAITNQKYKVLRSYRSSQGVGFFLILVSVVLSFMFFVLFEPLVENFDKSLLGGVPYVGLILLAAIVGFFFNTKDVQWLVFLVMAEIVVGVAEFLVGTHSFFGVAFNSETQIGATDHIYYNRVYGASSSSSAYAFKVLVGLVAYSVLRPKIGWRWQAAVFVLFVLGFLTSFNRTAIISVLLWLFVLNLRNVKVLVGLGVLFVALLATQYKNIAYSFGRGREGLDLSGRDFIFSKFYYFFEQSPVYGNASRKVWFESGGRIYHAHNSYLEFFVSNGLIVSILFFIGYYLMVLRGRIVIAFPILIYSMFQYGVLWGFVFHDIVFFGLMFYVARKELERGWVSAREIVPISK